MCIRDSGYTCPSGFSLLDRLPNTQKKQHTRAGDAGQNKQKTARSKNRTAYLLRGIHAGGCHRRLALLLLLNLMLWRRAGPRLNLRTRRFGSSELRRFRFRRRECRGRGDDKTESTAVTDIRSGEGLFSYVLSRLGAVMYCVIHCFRNNVL